MQQFQDDIMRAKQMTLKVEERLLERIETLESRLAALEQQMDQLNH